MDEKGQSGGNGASISNGNTVPIWLRLNWEFREAYESRFCSWTVMA